MKNYLIATLAATVLVCPTWSYAQEPPPASVRYTTAIEHAMRTNVTLPGYVESPHASVLASEIDGLVSALKVREGDSVEKDQILVMLRTTPLELRLRAARGELKEAIAREELARRNMDRSTELFASKTVSQQVMDEAQFDHAAWQGRIDRLRADIAGIEFDIHRSAIRAPFNGVVVARHTEVGEWADSGKALLEIISMDVLEVHVDVPERYFVMLQPGLPARVRFDGVPARDFSATIRAVIPRADSQARTFPTKLRLQTNDPAIGVGMLARVAFEIGNVKAVVLVPKDAIVRQGPVQFVYVLTGEGTARQVAVEEHGAMGAWVAVNSDIKPGDRVITRGNERLRPGQAINGGPIDYPEP